jgi:hypothetical protein
MSKEDGRKKEGVRKIGREKRIGVGKRNAVVKIKIGSDPRSAAALKSNPGWMRSTVARHSGTLRDLPGRGLCRRRRDAKRRKLRGTEIVGCIDRRCR